MGFLDHIAKMARLCDRGTISPKEFASFLSDSFAGDRNLTSSFAVEVAALIPYQARNLVLRQVEAALADGYLRQAFAFGGIRTIEQEHAAAIQETEHERAWAKAMWPVLSQMPTRGETGAANDSCDI